MTIWRSPLPAALRHPVISTVTFQVELESFSTSVGLKFEKAFVFLQALLILPSLLVYSSTAPGATQ
jgi:hypothetical protein